MSRKVSSTIHPQLISKFHYIWATVHFKGSVIFWNKQDHVTPPYNILHWLLRTFRSACTLPPTKASRVPQVSSLLASHAPIPPGHRNAINHVHNCSMSPTPVTESPLSTTPFLLSVSAPVTTSPSISLLWLALFILEFSAQASSLPETFPEIGDPMYVLIIMPSAWQPSSQLSWDCTILCI